MIVDAEKMNQPPHYEPARPAWRFAAGAINLFFVGVVTVFAGWAVEDEDHVRLLVLMGVTAFWLVGAFRRKSLGGVFCLLEIRRADSSALSFTVYLLRTIPFYSLAFLAFFPAMGVLPAGFAAVQPLCLLALAGVLAFDAGFLLFTRRSLLDRWHKTAVVRLNLPAHLRPRFFGVRIS